MAARVYIDPERFIEQIKKRPELWKSSDKDYRNKFKKTSAWFEICEEFVPNFYERSELERNEWYARCTNRWRNMRDHYLKAQKKKSQPNLYKSTPKSYVFTSQLAFLRDEYCFKHRYAFLSDEDAEKEHSEKDKSPASMTDSEKDKSDLEVENGETKDNEETQPSTSRRSKKTGRKLELKFVPPTEEPQQSGNGEGKRKPEVEAVEEPPASKEEARPRPKRRRKKVNEVVTVPTTTETPESLPPLIPLSHPLRAPSEIDEDQAFFDSFLPIIKTFNLDQKLEMRCQFLNMIRSIRSGTPIQTQFFSNGSQTFIPVIQPTGREASVTSSPAPCDSPNNPPTPLQFSPDPLMLPSSPDIKTEP